MMSKPDTTYFVAGGGGYIGRALTSLLTAGDLSVVVASKNRIVDFPQKQKQLTCDIYAPGTWVSKIPENSTLYLLAWQGSVGLPDQSHNIDGHRRFLEMLPSQRIRHIVFASSGGTVYGDQTTPIAETSACSPISPYGKAKLLLEHEIATWARAHSASYSIARIGNTYGADQVVKGGQGLIAAILSAWKTGNPLTIWGDGTNTRDYVHVTDVAQALFALGTVTEAQNQIFNVGTGIGSSARDLIEHIERITSQVVPVRFENARSIDVARNVLDISLMRNQLGWFPKVSLEDGLRQIFSA